MRVLSIVYLSLALVLRPRIWIRGLWFGGSYRQREEALSHDDGSGKSLHVCSKVDFAPRIPSVKDSTGSIDYC